MIIFFISLILSSIFIIIYEPKQAVDNVKQDKINKVGISGFWSCY